MPETETKTIYFGHPVNTYGTEPEAQLLAMISNSFPECEIENPNQEKHQEGYRRWKEKTGNGMDYFFKEVLPACHLGIFLPFRDGRWPAGVYKEASFMAETGCRIFQIWHTGEIIRLNIENLVPLSIEETRKLIRTSNGDRVPY